MLRNLKCLEEAIRVIGHSFRVMLLDSNISIDGYHLGLSVCQVLASSLELPRWSIEMWVKLCSSTLFWCESFPANSIWV